MASDSDQDQLIPLRAVPRLSWLPRRRGKPIHIATVFRWCERGILGADGQRHRLRAIRVGGVPCVTQASLLDFFGALSRTPDSPPHPTRTGRNRAARRAGRELERAGI